MVLSQENEDRHASARSPGSRPWASRGLDVAVDFLPAVKEALDMTCIVLTHRA